MVSFRLINDVPLLRPVVENLIQNLGKFASEGRVIQKGEGLTNIRNKTV